MGFALEAGRSSAERIAIGLAACPSAGMPVEKLGRAAKGNLRFPKVAFDRSRWLQNVVVYERRRFERNDMSRIPVREKILDAAEALFVARGYHGVSMRQVADSASVSLSLTQYHSKSKEALFGAVLERRVVLLNHQRLARLDALEQEAEQKRSPIALEDVLRAFLEPTVLLSRDKASGGSHYAQLLAQITNDPQPHARHISRTLNDPMARQTMRFLQMALPDMDRASLAWCYIFSVGAMIAAVSPTGRAALLSNGEADPDDVQRIMQLLVPFLSGALQRVALEVAQPQSRKRSA